MTAAEMVEVLPKFFDSLEQGDLVAADAIVDELVAPDCEFTSQIGTAFDGQTYRGPQGIRSWFRDLSATMALRYEDRRFEIRGENAIVLLTRFVGEGRGSGAEISRDIGIVWQVEDGSVSRVVSYETQADAIAAAEALAA